jgi:RNA polymerase sigma-70 factor (ECF subfamily)
MFGVSACFGRIWLIRKKLKTLKRFYINEVLWIGDEKVTDFGEIYTEHFSDVYKYVLTLCRNEAIAEEVTQETFFKAMRNIDQFNGSCKLYVWLCQIAKNTYFSLSKKQKRMAPAIDADFPDIASDLEKDYFDKEAATRLHVLLHDLNEPYKEVFTLRVFGELPFSQIGELFGKTDSWARLIFYRAKKQLQEAIK